MRAYLIVPAVSPGSLGAALESGPDALVVDGASADFLALAGVLHARLVADARDMALWVRLSGVEAPAFPDELAVAMPAAPTAIVIPVRHGRDVAHAGALLAVHEAELGLADRTTRIVAMIADSAGVLNAGTFVGSSPRLAALGWDAGALSAELQAGHAYEAESWIAPLGHARSLVRLAAAAAGVEAVEASGLECGETAFRRHVAAARRDGFGAVFVSDPRQLRLLRR